MDHDIRAMFEMDDKGRDWEPGYQLSAVPHVRAPSPPSHPISANVSRWVSYRFTKIFRPIVNQSGHAINIWHLQIREFGAQLGKRGQTGYRFHHKVGCGDDIVSRLAYCEDRVGYGSHAGSQPQCTYTAFHRRNPLLQHIGGGFMIRV